MLFGSGVDVIGMPLALPRSVEAIGTWFRLTNGKRLVVTVGEVISNRWADVTGAGALVIGMPFVTGSPV